MQEITALLRRAWDFFGIIEPHLGISFGAIYLGVFVIAMSLRFLVPLLGIGHSYDENLIAGYKRGLKWRDESRRNREIQARREHAELMRRAKNFKLKV